MYNISNKSRRLSLVAAIVAAVLASACCWIPLVLVLLGVTGIAIGAAFEPYRYWFAGMTVVMVAIAVLLTYRRRGQACGEQEPCCEPGGRIRHFNKIAVWLVAAAAIGLAFLPDYVGALMRQAPAKVSDENGETFVVKIEGMSCNACAIRAAIVIQHVEGVAHASVSYPQGKG